MNNRTQRTPAQNAWDYMQTHLKIIYDAVLRDDFSEHAAFMVACQNAINYIEIIQACANDTRAQRTKATPADVANHESIAFDVKTYRDVVKERDPTAVRSGYGGGMIGCPGSYLLGAPSSSACCHGSNIICTACWDSPYQGEAWCGSEEGKDEE